MGFQLEKRRVCGFVICNRTDVLQIATVHQLAAKTAMIGVSIVLAEGCLLQFLALLTF